MSNVTNNSRHWYSYNWLNMLFCLFFLPLGLIAFWKNGQKIAILVVSGIWASLLFYVWSYESTPKNPTISGLSNLSISSLLMEMEGNGYLIETSMKPNMEWNASMINGEYIFDMMVYPMDGSAIEKIVLKVKNDSGNITEIQNIFLKVASLPYDTAKPKQAQTWLNENIGKAQSESVFGKAKFTLTSSLKSNFQLSIKAIN